MRIEALEKFHSGGYSPEAGDIITVPDEVGARACAHGWARDVTGAVATGDRVPGVSTLNLPNTSHSQTGA